jgi:DNA recombination protein RmuC
VDAYNRTVGSFESRVFITARKLRDLHVTEAELEAMEVIEASVRPLTAPELLALEEIREEEATRRWVTGTPRDAGRLPGLDSQTG